LGEAQGLDAVAGAVIETEYGVSGIRPSVHFPGLWQNILVTAYAGVRCLRDGVTLTLQRTVTGSVAGELLREVTSRSLAELTEGREGLMTRFGSGPTPRFSRREAGGEERECIDLVADQGPVDIVTGVVRDNIDTTPTPHGMCWGQGVRIRYPTRRLIFDHYVHRSLDERWIATGNCFWWTPTLTAHPLTDWHERILVPVRVERDESGRLAPPVQEWDRAVELNRVVLSAVGWNARDLIRYRVWVERPVWGSMVYLSFLSAGQGQDPRPGAR
jgi:hypothetical protein